MLQVSPATDHSSKNAVLGNGKACSRECNPSLLPNRLSIRGVVTEVLASANPDKELLSLALGDASSYACFAEGKKGFTEALAAAVSSAEHDCYAPSFGFALARR